MDNPQHYQPLSHALHPPSTNVLTRGHNSHFGNSQHHPSYEDMQNQATQNGQREDEDEEDEEDDDDEGLVEEQLNQNDVEMHGSEQASPQPSSSAGPHASIHAPQHSEPTSPAQEPKRRPGRPRGSKNRRPRLGAAKHETQFYYHPTTSTSTPVEASTSISTPQHPNISPQNQHYYEFQWRVLNLCAEFYGAAEELVKGTSPLVIAQCYSMGPGAKVDPLVMLAEAKRICDTLLSNPAQLITNPPAPVYPMLPPLYHHVAPPSISHPSSTPSVPPNASNVITNPQTFVVPLGVQPTGYPQYPIYAAPPGQYPAAPYYQYPAAYGQPGYYPPPPSQPMAPTGAPIIVQAPAQQSAPQPSTTMTSTTATSGIVIGNQGAWSEEETERLKKLTEESRSKGPSGEIDWDWVIQEWGISRTRHQILIKATNMGLKESSTRGMKRRRDIEETVGNAAPMASLQHPATSVPTMPSPEQSNSQPASTPAASPALQNQQQPTASKAPLSSSATPALPWPMPTMAVNTPSPVLSASSNVHDQQRSNYYRPRPSQDPSSKAPQVPGQHPFMYTPSGQMPTNLRAAESGK